MIVSITVRSMEILPTRRQRIIEPVKYNYSVSLHTINEGEDVTFVDGDYVLVRLENTQAPIENIIQLRSSLRSNMGLHYVGKISVPIRQPTEQGHNVVAYRYIFTEPQHRQVVARYLAYTFQDEFQSSIPEVF